jgi:hypothetical protein
MRSHQLALKAVIEVRPLGREAFQVDGRGFPE